MGRVIGQEGSAPGARRALLRCRQGSKASTQQPQRGGRPPPAPAPPAGTGCTGACRGHPARGAAAARAAGRAPRRRGHTRGRPARCAAAGRASGGWRAARRGATCASHSGQQPEVWGAAAGSQAMQETAAAAAAGDGAAGTAGTARAAHLSASTSPRAHLAKRATHSGCAMYCSQSGRSRRYGAMMTWRGGGRRGDGRGARERFQVGRRGVRERRVFGARVTAWGRAQAGACGAWRRPRGNKASQEKQPPPRGAAPTSFSSALHSGQSLRP